MKPSQQKRVCFSRNVNFSFLLLLFFSSIVWSASQKSPITSHVLDTTRGKPAANVPVTLYKFVNNEWSLLKTSVTNEDGRCNDLVSSGNFSAGRYKVHFLVSQYFQSTNTKSMYPFVEIVFDLDNPSEHYHIPLLLNPFGYSTYRGS